MPVFAPPQVALNPFRPMVQANAVPHVSVICPVFDQIELTIDFVINMLPNIQPPHELVIVANGCTDATASFLAQWKRAGRNIKPIISERNRGFGGGNNLGAREAENDVWLFLSNDVRATGDFIPTILDALRFHPRAIVGAQMHSHDTGWNRFIAQRDISLGGTPYRRGDSLIIPYVQGWCVAVDSRYCHKNKPQNKEQVGGLWDERYLLCDYDDLDVSIQALADNAPLVAIKELPLEHVHTGQTANKIPGGRLKVTEANRARFMEKWGLALP